AGPANATPSPNKAMIKARHTPNNIRLEMNSGKSLDRGRKNDRDDAVSKIPMVSPLIETVLPR
ncbi:MAG: hypothetical protein FWF30_02785, partial [Coriobacteriia bacterium]|nr:hypothetical protein [Coriobacteriia bacterium]